MIFFICRPFSRCPWQMQQVLRVVRAISIRRRFQIFEFSLVDFRWYRYKITLLFESKSQNLKIGSNGFDVCYCGSYCQGHHNMYSNGKQVENWRSYRNFPLKMNRLAFRLEWTEMKKNMSFWLFLAFGLTSSGTIPLPFDKTVLISSFTHLTVFSRRAVVVDT